MNSNLTKHSTAPEPRLSQRLFALVPTGGSGMPAASEGPIEVLVMAILGGFIGLMTGFVLTKLSRFVVMFTGRSIGHRSWSMFGAIAGALAFAVFALVSGD